MKSITSVLIGMLIAGAAYAIDGYVTDKNGKLVRDGYGHCVRTGTWTPEKAIEECQPNFIAKVKPATANTDNVIDSKVAMETVPEVQPLVAQPAIIATELSAVTESSLPTATVFFEFDKAVLTLAAKEQLDRVADGLKGREYKSITVVGYADKLGTKKYNKKLSQRRADAVKNYLVQQGVKTPESVGNGVIELKTVKCSSRKKTDLILCYSHDRRAEVVVH